MPLDPKAVFPLTESEISKASGVVLDHLKIEPSSDDLLDKIRFVAVSLAEPSRTAVLAGKETRRQAEIVTIDPRTGLATEMVVDLDSAKVASSTVLPKGKQPMYTPDDCDLAEAIVQKDPKVAMLLKERYGIEDMSRVACDPWSVHLASDADRDELVGYDKESSVAARLVQTFLYYRQDGVGMEDNHYAHPIDLLPVVDLNAKKVITIGGADRPAPKIPKASVNYHRNLVSANSYLESTWRSDTMAALNVVQPDGPSFKVDAETNTVNWQKWTFKVGFNYREGLVLHDVSFDGRPVLARAALVEMAVPYADPHPPFQRKCAFDVGDYGLGYCANSLELGCDCLGHIHYFDAVLPGANGKPTVKKAAVCMHEEDVGILWKHVEYRNGHNESRRSRELVLSSIATVVNYEYLFYWRLKCDGTIDFEIKLSGELSTNLLSEGEEVPSHGVMVAPGVNAQIHQHMFCARLDFCVDGFDNKISEYNIVREPVSPQNPYGNAFGAVETVLETESKAIRTADQAQARFWKVSSCSKKNPINGKPTAYKLVPFTKGPAQPVLMVDDSCEVAKKGAFATQNLWVTPYAEDERFPAGNYTPQGDGQVGLPAWTAKNRNLVGPREGLVVWHAFGVLHVPRLEDFPVMPCEMTGFSIKPDNFFSGNPAIDLPPEKNAASKLAAGCNGCAK
mmetsp:Transcript_44446/g.96647  ORF Transcript_44446/g.96647 Transcript_44446/m.96647 type:complete len:678 (-) Transcript_44446:296-2329(-)